MDETTRAVKNMYEEYPYPAGVPTMRAGFDVDLLLSYVQKVPAKKAQRQALDAGCGRGLGLIAAATLQKDVSFICADINMVGLADAQQNAAARGLNNISFVQADLMTLEDIEIPPGGFDVIYSSGVLHHLSDPATGLKNLEKILAPHGVISLMVYGRYGRQALYRLIDSLDLLTGREPSPKQRLPAARLLAQVAEQSIFKGNYWQGTAQVHDTEFVDRCLNVNETSYDIERLWQLLEQAGMKFVRWIEPDDWAIEKLIQDQELRSQLMALTPTDQFKIIERLFERPKLELILCKKSNQARSELTSNDIPSAVLAVNPEVSFLLEKRNLNQAQRIESLSYKHKTQATQQVSAPSLVQAMLLLVDQTDRFLGKDLQKALESQGVSKTESNQVLRELLNKEILYSPH